MDRNLSNQTKQNNTLLWMSNLCSTDFKFPLGIKLTTYLQFDQIEKEKNNYFHFLQESCYKLSFYTNKIFAQIFAIYQTRSINCVFVRENINQNSFEKVHLQFIKFKGTCCLGSVDLVFEKHLWPFVIKCIWLERCFKSRIQWSTQVSLQIAWFSFYLVKKHGRPFMGVKVLTPTS